VTESTAKWVFTNLNVYRQISLEAAAVSAEQLEKLRRPIPDHPGRFELLQDPARLGFKNALISIVFAGMYIEAMLHFVALERLPENRRKKTDRLPLEERVQALGVSDPTLLAACMSFREARKTLVHEKAASPENLQEMRTAQDESRLAVELLIALEAAYGRAAT